MPVHALIRRKRDEFVRQRSDIAADALANLGGRDRMRLQLEDLDPVRPRLGLPAGPGRDAEARQLEQPFRLLPRREVGELIGADQEDRILVVGCFERVDGVAMPLELDGCVEAGERQPRHREPVLGRSLRELVRRVGDDRDVQLVEAEVLPGRSRERKVAEVRWVEPAAEDPYCHSRTSSPISTSWPLWAPAAFRTASSSSPWGASPMIRKPRSVR